MATPKKPVDPKQDALTRIWEYLLQQGIFGYNFPTYDSSYMGDVQKIYEDTILQKPSMTYDSVTPKYESLYASDDPTDKALANQMAEFFRLIEVEGYSPKTFTEDPNLQLTENQKADLFQYAQEKEVRDKAIYDYNVTMGQKAELYGLPDPYATFKLPPNVVKDLVRQKDGVTPAEAAKRELAMLRKQESEQRKVLEARRKRAPTEMVQREKSDLASTLFNKTIGAIAPSTKIKEYVEVDKPETPMRLGGARGAMISALSQLEKEQLDFEDRLQQALTQQIMEKYGTPFDAAVKEAARIAASRKKGASGNWPA